MWVEEAFQGYTEPPNWSGSEGIVRPTNGTPPSKVLNDSRLELAEDTFVSLLRRLQRRSLRSTSRRSSWGLCLWHGLCRAWFKMGYYFINGTKDSPFFLKFFLSDNTKVLFRPLVYSKRFVSDPKNRIVVGCPDVVKH